MSDHTAGPWVASDQHHGVGWRVESDAAGYPNDGWVIASDMLGPDAEANARLIAAAPELLEAAEDALAGWNYIRAAHGDLYGVGWDRVERALSSAIAKAVSDGSKDQSA